MAETAADKLALLKATKADLKAALTEKGQTPGDVFSTYPDMVRAIQTGGGLGEYDVVIVGDAGTTGAYVEINGTKYTSAAIVTCKQGDKITAYSPKAMAECQWFSEETATISYTNGERTAANALGGNAFVTFDVTGKVMFTIHCYDSGD